MAERLTALELEHLMVRHFGEDFRKKAFVNGGGSFRLADVFAECGVRDPHPLRGSRLEQEGGWGLWQQWPSSRMPGLDPLANARTAMTIDRYGGTCSMSRELVLSRHMTRRTARRREAQLEVWMRTVRDWLRDPQPMEAVRYVTAIQRDVRELPGLDVADSVHVPERVLAAAHHLGEAGVFYTDHVRVEPRRRRFRWVVVSTPVKVEVPAKEGRGWLTS